MKLLKSIYRWVRSYISLFLLFYSYIFKLKVNSKLLLYLRGSSLEFRILKNFLLCKVRSRENDLNLASFLYLTGYSTIALSIYKHNSLRARNSSAVKLYFPVENFKAFGHSAFISTFIREALLRGSPYPKFYFDQKFLYDNPRLIEAYIISFPELFSKDAIEGARIVDASRITLSFIKYEKQNLWFDEWSHKIEMIWEKSPFKKRTIRLDDEYILKCKKTLQENYGMISDHKFILLHIRDSSSSKLMNLRDSKPSTYRLAIQKLLEQGFHVFRVGIDSANYDFKIDNHRFHDMTKDKKIQRIVDLYLFSHCHAFIGTGSGPANVAAQVFKKPSLLVNIAPLRSRVPSFNQVVLPKTYLKMTTGEVVPLELRCGKKLGHLESKSALRKLGIIATDNTESQIEEATMEFIESIDNFGIINPILYLIKDPINFQVNDLSILPDFMNVKISSAYAKLN